MESVAVRVPLGLATWKRTVAQEPILPLRNRFFEQDPSNVTEEQQVGLLSRQALRRWMTVGEGPIRGVYSQPGTFGEALFAASNEDLYRVNTDETVTLIGAIGATSQESVVSFAATDDPFLFLCDGGVLWLYTANGFATGTLTASGAIAANETVTIGTIVYKWTTGSVDAGTPAGTLANPWLVALGSSNTTALANMNAAIGDTGVPGTSYSTALTPHPQVIPISSAASTIKVRALAAGVGGNAIATTETGVNLAWGAATLTGGGASGLTQVVTPDDVGIISVGYIASFIICVVANGATIDGQVVNGRFYWIEPFETTIDPLNFATAESAPDPCWSVNVIGDQFWLPGSNRTEVWYPTGDELVPFLRVQARAFDRGTWEGTTVQVKDTLVLVDRDAVVWGIPGGAGTPVRLSNNSIEERIRQAMNAQILAG
jgi:hypothetical protein